MPRIDCPTPAKIGFPSRRAARGGRTRFDRKEAGHLSIYRCSCGSYHLGRLAREVVEGVMERRKHT